jgi:two-component system sensor histidine kinase KdpD
MQPRSLSSLFSLENLGRMGQAVLTVAALTMLMILVGRNRLGEGVIALLYLIPISWSTARWGQGPGIAAAVAAGLAFNFFFIPPFYTLYIGSLEGWLLLFIFLGVAILVVGRIQAGFEQARQREREAIFSYELSVDLAAARTPQAIARLLAEKTGQVFQASAVEVLVSAEPDSFTAVVPENTRPANHPDVVLPILGSRCMEGEIHLYNGEHKLPSGFQDRLLRNFASQSALALERIRIEKQDDQVPPPGSHGLRDGIPQGVND